MFSNFYEDMGDPPADKPTIDRRDVNGNYEPSNCRWASYAQQARNKRTTPIFNGKRISIKELTETYGACASTVSNYIKRHGYDGTIKALQRYKKVCQ